METRDTMTREASGPAPEPDAGSPAPVRISIDRFEMKRQFQERAEEEKVEAAAELYEKAVRQWLPEPDQPEQMDDEELEALSQELKLRQKCQDIAAQIMVDELEEGLEDEDD